MNRRQWLSVLVAALPMWRAVPAVQRRQPSPRPAPSPGERAPAFTEILKIDIHSHVFEDMPALNEMLRRNNVRTMNVCNNGTDGHLETMHRIALELFRKYPDLFPFASTFDLTRINESGYADAAINWLEGTFRNGAIATKIAFPATQAAPAR